MNSQSLYRILICSIFFLYLSSTLFGQSLDSVTNNDSSYFLVDTVSDNSVRGIYVPHFIETYQLKQDSNYTMKKYYSTSEEMVLLRKIQFYKSLPHGRDTLFREKRFIVTTWKKGEKNGPYIDYYETGKIYMKGNYKDGMLVGTFLHYNTDGKIIRAYTYRAGKGLLDSALLEE